MERRFLLAFAEIDVRGFVGDGVERRLMLVMAETEERSFVGGEGVERRF